MVTLEQVREQIISNNRYHTDIPYLEDIIVNSWTIINASNNNSQEFMDTVIDRLLNTYNIAYYKGKIDGLEFSKKITKNY